VPYVLVAHLRRLDSMYETTLDEESIVVVGAGIGGLSAACYLADAGADVTVVERADHLGGVAGRIERDGFRFDMGPSWYLMPEVFERFFGHFDREPSEYYELTRLDPNYRVFWKDGDSAAVPADRAGQRDLFESYEAGAGEALEAYLDGAREAYEVGMEEFVYKDRPRLRDWVDPSLARAARGLTLLGTMDDHVREFFDHPKLRQLVEYTLVFLGGSPYNTPALYSLMSHVDYDLGVYYPEGGMASVVDAMATLARDLGVTFETGTEVTGIERLPEGLLVSTASDTRTADRVISNATPAATERELLPPGVADRDPEYWTERTYAPSAFMLYLGVEGPLPEFGHHTLVLPTDWSAHFERIFDEPAWPTNPSYYVNVPSRTDETVAPAGDSTMVILVPIAPGLPDGPEFRERYRDQVLSDLAEHTGVDLHDRIVVEERACIEEFSDLGYPQGTALGLAHTLRQTGPFRPGHRATAVDGLYYTGSFTTPGIGVPMCLISGEHTAAAVCEDVTSAAAKRAGFGLPSLRGD
jgi:phytoene desaturase